MTSGADENLFDEKGELDKRIKRGKKEKGGRYFEDGFDEELMGDEADRDRLNEMTELEREKILMDRHQKREELLKKRELLKHAAQRDAERDRKFKEISLLKEERKKRNERMNTEHEEAPADQVGKEQFYSRFLSDDDGSSESSGGDPKERGRPVKRLKTRGNNEGGREREGKEAKEEELPDREVKASDDRNLVNRICLTREFLVKMASHLYFKETVTGCLVKVSFNTSPDKIDYKIGQIVGSAR